MVVWGLWLRGRRRSGVHYLTRQCCGVAVWRRRRRGKRCAASSVIYRRCASHSRRGAVATAFLLPPLPRTSASASRSTAARRRARRHIRMKQKQGDRNFLQNMCSGVPPPRRVPLRMYMCAHAHSLFLSFFVSLSQGSLTPNNVRHVARQHKLCVPARIRTQTHRRRRPHELTQLTTPRRPSTASECRAGCESL